MTNPRNRLFLGALGISTAIGFTTGYLLEDKKRIALNACHPNSTSSISCTPPRLPSTCPCHASTISNSLPPQRDSEPGLILPSQVAKKAEMEDSLMEYVVLYLG